MAATAFGNKAQNAYHQIKRAVLAGTFQPGERLAESRVCEALGLSRAAVREALIRLQGEGFIKKQGACRSHVVEYVEDIPREELLARYELREQIEGAACRVAAKNMNGWQIDELRTLAERMVALGEQPDRESRHEANLAFHDFLMSNCGNSLLREVWDTQHLMPPKPRSQRLEDEINGQLPDVCVPSLVDLVDAIAAHDQNEAEARIRKRLSKITEALRRTDFDSSPINGRQSSTGDATSFSARPKRPHFLNQER